MFDISKVDKNFKINSRIEKTDIKFYNVDETPFKIYGIFKENGKYRRLPESVAKKVSSGVHVLHTHTTGGRVKFVTDSPYIAIYTKMGALGKMPHFALTGSIGFDMYEGDHFVNTFVPPFDITDGYESLFEFEDKKEREITINFPLYSEVLDLYIGLQENSVLKEAKPYKNDKPIVFYGSSITHGGCASRPGMSYQAILSRMFEYDYINLGFSGSALAEDEIADYIKNLDMSIFVYDYDWNAPTVEHLEQTHEKMFKKIREKHPHLPVIMMSRPKHFLTREEEIRRSIVEKTYLDAVSSGDKNVYFVDGKALTKLCGDSGTVDYAHPTDFGFYSMAKAVAEVITIINSK
ncbi:MAG: SGNH/GDSL hydrolase family protein [Clostridia bacterium]|nr:SGNH/GDSL hydrolase family protein [Clostridia bacterium]